MDRRTLLSLVAGGVAGLAGCSTPDNEVGTGTATATPEERSPQATATAAAARLGQRLTVWNPTPDPVFATVVGMRGGRDVFFRNVDLLPGERTSSRIEVPRADLAVVVETDTGIREETTWRVTEPLDGLEVVLNRSNAVFWRASTCSGDGECGLATGGDEADLPLVGDGLSRWYAPAALVVENPEEETEASIRVDLRDATLIDRRFRLPAGTRLSIPVTYRTGDYQVSVETADRDIDVTWQVPNEPAKYVDVTSGTTGCGPANTTLTVANRDDVAHRLSLRIETVSGVFDRDIDLAAGAVRTLVPVVESGPHRVDASLETGTSVSGTWWSCPPRGPATLAVDATGSLSLTAAGPQPG
ncbi:hypothetical protein [Haloferax larsenii]|uniref:Ig-like domain-containing protein n=1 Tax=Haloferax larsenii TaxID=302484 RepID=A0A1H7TGM6_HALLR|nr:hypothetical protein [Haloferax larsenii]SEL83564.1 hypothetical protein SAMN04488691_10928 [Haloferax larsenii]